jgi:hypothetical protein
MRINYAHWTPSERRHVGGTVLSGVADGRIRYPEQGLDLHLVAGDPDKGALSCSHGFSPVGLMDSMVNRL